MESRHELDEDRTALLAEELTDSELRELLRRLGEAEFGGSERSTVGAVVEATGRDAVEVGRILGDIRREEFDRKFGLELKAHELRIERLEDVTERIESRPAPAKAGYSISRVSMTDEEVEIIEELVEKRRLEKASTPFWIALLVVVAILLLALWASDNGGQPKESAPSGWREAADGSRIPVHWYKDQNGNRIPVDDK